MENKRKLKDWIIAVRPWSFPASSMPALVTFVFVFFLYKQQTGINPNWIFGMISIIGAVIFQISGNLISDYFDYKQGVDREDTFGSSRLLVNKTFMSTTILCLGLFFLVMGIGLGFFLFYHTGYPLLLIGGIGVIAALFYYYFKYRALGDLLIFFIYGPMITLGTFYSMTSVIDWKVIWLSIPIGCITVNILHANNTRDIVHDRRANIRTLAMQLGIKGSIIEYISLITVAYLSLAVMVATGFLHWLVIGTFLTLPVAIRNCKIMRTASINNMSGVFLDLDVKTAQLQLMFSTLFAGLMFVSAWL
jgi:1,4-dihydroxy-2-naphthoate octaprenyltransferase